MYGCHSAAYTALWMRKRHRELPRVAREALQRPPKGVTPNSSWPDVPAQRRCGLRMCARGECVPDVAAIGVIQRKPRADSPLLYRTPVGSRIDAQS